MSGKITGYCSCCGHPRIDGIIEHDPSCISHDVVENPEPDHEMESVIADGIQFVTSLTAYYGPTKGMEVWDAMGEAVGKSLKHKIFMAMMSGGTSHTVAFRAAAAESAGNAVPVIKCITTFTGFGFKEAKDYWDASKINIQHIKCSDAKVATEFRKELRNLGCQVS